MNLRDPRGRAIKDGIPTSPHGGRQSALVENNSDDIITAILESFNKTIYLRHSSLKLGTVWKTSYLLDNGLMVGIQLV